MKRTRQIKLNALRAEIQRLRDVAFEAKMEAARNIKGATETIMLTEKLIVAAFKKCGVDSIEIIPDMTDDTPLMFEKTEKGILVRFATEDDIAKLSTESDKDCGGSKVE